jgi:hypothetical protein
MYETGITNDYQQLIDTLKSIQKSTGIENQYLIETK